MNAMKNNSTKALLLLVFFLGLSSAFARSDESKIPIPANFPPVINNDQERDAACAIMDQMDQYEIARRKTEPNMKTLISLCLRRGVFKKSENKGY